jgi:membrane-associated phospholipid phosphatase
MAMEPKERADKLPTTIDGDATSDQRRSQWGRIGARWPRFLGGFQVLAKTFAIIAYFFAWFFAYDLVNRYVSDPVRTVHLTTPYQLCPAIIQPYSSVIYIFGGVLLPILPFFYHASWSGIRFILCCYTLTSLIAFVCYCIWPLSMVRPNYSGEDFGERLMLWVFSMDLPGNCFPSSHVFFATFGAVFVSRSKAQRAVRVVTWILAVAVCISTVTSGQHYFIDIPGGVVTAFVGYIITRKIISYN